MLNMVTFFIMHGNNVMPRRKLSSDWLKNRVTELCSIEDLILIRLAQIKKDFIMPFYFALESQ